MDNILNSYKYGRNEKLCIITILIVYCGGFSLSLYDGLNNDISIKYTSPLLYGDHGLEEIVNIKSLVVNNLIAYIVNYLGVFSMGIISLANTLYNSSYFGFILGNALRSQSLSDISCRILPHSFELIPILTSSADGLLLGVKIFLSLLGRSIQINIYLFFIRFILGIVVLFMAALVEFYISMHL